MSLAKYNAANIEQLMDRITKNSIGMDEYFDRVFSSSVNNYPPYNVVQVNNSETRLEIALAGFKKEQVNAYTEYGKLFVRGKKNHLMKRERLSTRDWLKETSKDPGASCKGKIISK